jgi:thiamine kinase-like enzyme
VTTTDRIAGLPCWTGNIEMEPLAGGLSNESWLVTDGAGRHVVRFGTDYPFHHVSRDREAMVARAAHAAGFSPQVQHSEPGIMVSAYIDARTWTEEDMRAQPRRVAGFIREFHSRMPEEITGQGYIFWVFHVVREYGRLLESGKSRYKSALPRFRDLAVEMEAVQIPLPIVFGHNDLLPANILDDGSRLWLIDFEYAGFSTAMFDLAGAASNSAMDEATAGALLEAYFGEPADEATKRSFAAMQCMSLLRESMWAMVSELHLNAPGADYAAYARENLARLEAAVERYRTKYGKTGT